SGNTLFECISNLFDTIKKLDYLRIEDILDEPITNITDLKSYIFDKLYIKDDEDEYEECIGLSKIDNFLNLDIEIFRAWYSYIKAETNKEVVYHTYHGTKGLEFDNVIIFMKNSFNRNSDFFTGFFKNYTTLSNQHRSPQNLLYVAVTRAKKNLAILFLDELPKDDTVLNIEKIFGKINKALEV
ncbi:MULTISPECIES: 3'-5' exonuclease, partial [Bacteria]|uniref:3'-5' exonuclease n=1 Tax=Bacteria TaxID=2 RepID=UPI003F36B14A